MPAINGSAVGARPFLKWAGGKSQLLPELCRRFPPALAAGGIVRYIEPFLGSGALFFHLAQAFSLREHLLLDTNPDLVLTYQTIQNRVEEVIEVLGNMEREYCALSPDGQREYYYRVRDAFNEVGARTDAGVMSMPGVVRAAQFLFMNKTCFNGLFRVNSRGLFNVPFGRHRRPTICNASNLRLVSWVLQRAEIRTADFEDSGKFVDDATFIYFDPPYRPLGGTAYFTSYAATPFNDGEQGRLAAFFRKLDARGAKLMMSNSDPKNERAEDDFFEKAYTGFTIERVKARRTINSDATRRGRIYELIITNYHHAPGAFPE